MGHRPPQEFTVLPVYTLHRPGPNLGTNLPLLPGMMGYYPRHAYAKSSSPVSLEFDECDLKPILCAELGYQVSYSLNQKYLCLFSGPQYHVECPSWGDIITYSETPHLASLWVDTNNLSDRDQFPSGSAGYHVVKLQLKCLNPKPKCPLYRCKPLNLTILISDSGAWEYQVTLTVWIDMLRQDPCGFLRDSRTLNETSTKATSLNLQPVNVSALVTRLLPNVHLLKTAVKHSEPNWWMCLLLQEFTLVAFPTNNFSALC